MDKYNPASAPLSTEVPESIGMAGFLASGSSYWPRLPKISFSGCCGFHRLLQLRDSGGFAPPSHLPVPAWHGTKSVCVKTIVICYVSGVPQKVKIKTNIFFLLIPLDFCMSAVYIP